MRTAGRNSQEGRGRRDGIPPLLFKNGSRIQRALYRAVAAFLVCLGVVVSGTVPSSAQTANQVALPVIFVHGFCDSANSIVPLEQDIKSLLHENSPGLYGNTDEYVAFYDDTNVWFQKPTTSLTASDPILSVQYLKKYDPGARFFDVALYDSTHSDYRYFNPLETAAVPVYEKGNELAHIIWAVKQVTGAPRVIVVAHSLGGLDARSYIEGLATPTDYASNDLHYFNDIASLVTLDTPDGGTRLTAEQLSNLAYYVGLVLPSVESQCYAGPSIDKTEMSLSGSASVIPQLNYDSTTGPTTAAADQLPAGLTITSISSEWAVLTNLLPLPGPLDDNVLGIGEQTLASNLGPNAQPLSNLQTVNNTFDYNYVPAGCGTSVPLHLLSCTGSAIQTIMSIESAVEPYDVMTDSGVQITASPQTVSSAETSTLTASTSSGGPVIWSILEGASGGSITQSGKYTAPPNTPPPNTNGAPETFHIIAIDSQHPSYYGEIAVQVNASNAPVPTTTTLSAGATHTVQGVSDSLTATVQSGGGSPTGNITFYAGTTALNSPIAINGGGTATYSASNLTLGSHTITADYSGDANYAASVSSAVTISVTADDPILSVVPSSGTAGITQFTKVDTGFAPNGLITHTVTLPDGSQSIKQTYADSNGACSYSVVYSTPGPYSQVDTDASSGTQTSPVTWTVSPPVVNDFSLQAAPASTSITQSGTATVEVETATVGSTPQSLVLEAMNLPAGVTASFSPSSINSGQTSALTFSANSSAVPGTYSVTVAAASSTTNHSVAFSLNVTSAPTGPAVSLTPALVQFNSQAVGTQSTGETVRLMNSGSGTLQVYSIALAAGSDYVLSLPSGGFPLLLNPLVPYDIQVAFAPTATGLRTGQLIIYDNAPDSPQVVQLTGTGTAAQPSTGSITVTATLNGTPLPADTNAYAYTLSGPATYSGEGPYTFSAEPGTYTLAFSGTPSYLTLSSITPSTSQTITAGGTASFTLNFTAPNDFYAPQFLSSSGGVTPQLVLSGSNASYTVGFGGIPSGSAASPISLAVSGVPPGASATFNPEPVYDNTDSTLTIATGTATSGIYSLGLSGTNSSGFTRSGATSTLVITTPPAQAPQLASQSTGGTEANGACLLEPEAMSSDGRYVVLESSATNLGSSYQGIYVRDLTAGTTSLVSVSSSGVPANNESYTPSISADGRYVAFDSSATNLTAGAVSGNSGIYVRDTQAGTTERVDLANDGTVANGNSSGPTAISADGRFVAFISAATNLVSGASGEQAYLHDRANGTTELASVSNSGSPANASVNSVAISADGRFVAFVTAATNLTTQNTGGRLQLYVHDFLTKQTTLLSVGVDGQPANNNVSSGSGTFGPPVMSAGGRYTVFSSYATNLITEPVDTNGAHLFMHDSVTGQNRLIDVDSVGTPLGGWSSFTNPAISADGRFVSFTGFDQVLIHDTVSNRSAVVSLSSNGAAANNTVSPQYTAISPGGGEIAFVSTATNLASNTSGNADVFVAQNPFVSSPFLQSAALSSGSVVGGTVVTYTVTLNAPAPTGGATVNLATDNSTVLQIPSVIYVPAGDTTAAVSLPTVPVSTETSLTITASYNDGSSAVVLAVESGAILGTDPPAEDFGYQAVGTTSAPEPITLTNSGTAPLTLNSVQLASGQYFSISQNTCGSTVAVGSSCSVSVTFKPASSGSLSDTLQISYGSPASVQSVSLTGTGATASAVLDPTTLSFGNTSVFATSMQTLSLSNSGTDEMTGISTSISGQNAGNFSISHDGCTGVVLPANTSCSLTVSFAPDSAGQMQANLLVADSAAGSPQTVALSGNATTDTPVVTVQPSSSSVTTAQSLSVSINVAGVSGEPAPTGSVTLTSGSYSSAATTLSSGAATISIPAGQLAAGADTLTAAYTPDSSSSSTYNSASGSATVSVTQTPAGSFSLSNTGSISISPGATTGNTTTITATPSSGFTGSVNLSCKVTSTPSNATDPVTCNIPSQISITGTSASTATLTVDSAASTSNAVASSLSGNLFSGGGFTLAILCFLGFGGLRKNWSRALVLCVIVGVFGLMGCGGANSLSKSQSTGGTSGTTPGAYVVTVTGNSGTVTQTTNVTVTVN